MAARRRTHDRKRLLRRRRHHEGACHDGGRGDERDVGRWNRCGRGADCAAHPSATNAARWGQALFESSRCWRMRTLLIRLLLRRAVLAAMNAASTSTAELARLNWRLGLAYAEAVKITRDRHKVKLDLVGCHGQTLYHQARAEPMRAEVCLHMASGRGAGDCRGAGRAGGFELPAGRYVGRRPGSTAGSASGLCAVRRSTNAGACCKILAASRI